MFERKYQVYFGNSWFDSFYATDYYNDKPNFFAYGAKQFFTIYQILRNGDFHLTIVEEISEKRFEIDNSADFKNWVVENYHYFAAHLDKLY